MVRLRRPPRIKEVVEVSAMVSTNHVYRLELEGGSSVVTKVSSYGSYFLFREDHDRLHQCRELLQRTRHRNLLADVLTRDGRIFTHYTGELWTVFYEDVPRRDALPWFSRIARSRTSPRRSPTFTSPATASRARCR